MAKNRLSSDLRNRYNEIFLYDNEMLCIKNEFHRLLDEGIESNKLEQGRPAQDVFADIEKEYPWLIRFQQK
ncbi:MAG: hypothetical protein HDT44_08195 [Ruminococcaceae bacterium]|nr:hypothetical protein [Oscillospiraceae bacterium]